MTDPLSYRLSDQMYLLQEQARTESRFMTEMRQLLLEENARRRLEDEKRRLQDKQELQRQFETYHRALAEFQRGLIEALRHDLGGLQKIQTATVEVMRDQDGKITGARRVLH